MELFNKKLNKDVVSKSAIPVNIGLDISTSIIGICILHAETDQLISLHAIKLNKAKLKDVWDKADYVKNNLQTTFAKKNFDVKNIFVEEAAMAFSPGFSSAGTLFALARFNGIVSYICYSLLHTKATMVNVRTARKLLGIKINVKDKTKDTKTKIFEAVKNINPDFPWEEHVAKTGKKKGQVVFGKQNQDMADAWVICLGGKRSLSLPKNPTKKKTISRRKRTAQK